MSVIKKINEYNKGLPAELRHIKLQALTENPFRFYRGTCHLFAADFAKLYGFKSKIKTWICGDLHFENFGSFKGENRLVYFDVSDFDESILLSPEPELTRFLSSIIIAGQELSAAEKDIYNTIKELMSVYVETLLRGKALMMEQELAKGVLKDYFQRVAARDRQSFIAKHTTKQNGKIVLKEDHEHFFPIDKKLKKEIIAGIKPLLKTNKHFSGLQLLDAAFRIAGTGSLGLQRYCVLCYNDKTEKYYLIDVKEARRSCYRNVADIKQPKFQNEANRIIYTEYTMQFNTASFLASVRIENKWFVVKEMQPVIDKMTLTDFKEDFASFREVAIDMAPLIAYAHLRSSGHHGASTADDLMGFAHKQQWQDDVLTLSAELAAYNNHYYKAFLKAKK